VGGAHRNHQEIAASLKAVLVEAFGELGRVSPDRLVEQRYQKFRRIGVFEES
jgi:acetyl-CoA carboxylase carboxyl transferase subunit alpha